jgi:hypothetical protein
MVKRAWRKEPRQSRKELNEQNEQKKQKEQNIAEHNRTSSACGDVKLPPLDASN